MSKKQVYGLLLGVIVAASALILSAIYSNELTAGLSKALKGQYAEMHETLDFKAQGGELVIVSRKWAGGFNEGQWVNSVNRFDALTHIYLPFILFSLLAYLIYQIRGKWILAISFLVANSALMLIRLALPVKNAFASQYRIINDNVERVYSGWWTDSILMPLQNLFDSYGAIGLRLYLPIIVFTVIIYPWLRRMSESPSFTSAHHKIK